MRSGFSFNCRRLGRFAAQGEAFAVVVLAARVVACEDKDRKDPALEPSAAVAHGALLTDVREADGSEFAEHEWISKHLGGVPVYFTDSYSSWQKGAVENTNKLIRQYIPKGTNINTITDTLITKIQKKINRRPREKLNFSTPVKELYKHYS